MKKASIIVCVRQRGDTAELVQSLEENCCLNPEEFEVLEQEGYSSMAGGYNVGVAQATSEVLVFTHSDVRLWAGRGLWEQMIWELANSPKLGFVGVAGTTQLGDQGCWWMGGDKRGAVVHQQDGAQYMSAFGPYGKAVVMDGVFLATTPRVMRQLGEWNPDLGFHLYDIEITLRAHLAGYYNRVIPLPLLHGSVGEVNDAWQESRRKFLAGYYGQRLPQRCS
jgi:GT2 family glycosyltransferase